MKENAVHKKMKWPWLQWRSSCDSSKMVTSKCRGRVWTARWICHPECRGSGSKGRRCRRGVSSKHWPNTQGLTPKSWTKRGRCHGSLLLSAAKLEHGRGRTGGIVGLLSSKVKRRRNSIAKNWSRIAGLKNRQDNYNKCISNLKPLMNLKAGEIHFYLIPKHVKTCLILHYVSHRG